MTEPTQRCMALTARGRQCSHAGKYPVGETPLCYLHHPWPRGGGVDVASGMIILAGEMMLWRDRKRGWVVRQRKTGSDR